MRKTLVALAATAAASVASSTASAQTTQPRLLSQEGYLLDSSDQPVSGEVEITFGLYDNNNPNEKTPLWSEKQTVRVQHGFYAALLGETTPIPASALATANSFLSVTVGNNELQPRLRVAAVPTALRANDAASADTVKANGVGTAALQDNAVTLAKLDSGLRNQAGKLDADTLDGLDSSAFAPAAIEGKVDAITATLGTPPAGSDMSQEIAAVRALAKGAATGDQLAALAASIGDGSSASIADRLQALASAVGSLGSTTVAARLDAAGNTISAVQASLGSLTGTTVAARADTAATRADAAATSAAALQTALGTLTGTTIAARTDTAATRADVAATRADVAATRADAAATAAVATQNALGTISGTTVAARTDAGASAAIATQNALGVISGATIGARVDAAYTNTNTLLTRLGTPAGTSLSADIASLTTAVTALQTSLNTYINDRKWKGLTANLYASLDTLAAQYPPTDWEWGIPYNGGTIVPVNLNSWNGGWRIMSIYAYNQGDQPSTNWAGGFALYKGTSGTDDDACNNGGNFLHYYTRPYTTGAIANGGNGCVNPQLFVRRW